MKQKQTNKLWGTAFHQSPSEAVIAFTVGRDVAALPPADAALLPYDLWVNMAHAVMLGKTGIIPKTDAAKIIKSLLTLKKLIESGKFTVDPSKEDIHTNIESWLTEQVHMEVAGKLHTARSRNDQVVTDMKLYMRDQVVVAVSNCIGMVDVLLDLAYTYKAVPFPGFTHHQHAMVTTFGHVLAGFASMISRDIERFQQWYKLHNTNPLGNAVSYGTSFPVDKKMTTSLLGFDSPDTNSLDAITNRWEPEADFVSAIAMLMNHLSLIAETLILLSTSEFGMIQLSDTYSTGSSMMPQKKNPDPLEVIKGKAGFAHGQLMSLMSMGSGNFIGFNRDSQWSKYVVMDCINECLPTPIVLAGVLETMTVHADGMEAWCHKGFIGSTSLMEQLSCVFSLPMRHAKILVEKAIKLGDNAHMVTFDALSKAIQEEHLNIPITSAQVDAWQSPKTIIGLTKSSGGPGKNSMKHMLKKLKKKQLTHKTWVRAQQKHRAAAKEHLYDMATSIMTEVSL